MTNNGKIEEVNLLRRWILILGTFTIAQLVFLTIDGTILEPNLNKIGHFAMGLIETKLFWFTLYDNPLFKTMTLIFILYMIITAIIDIVRCAR